MKNIAFKSKKKKRLINLAMKKVDRIQLLPNGHQCGYQQLSLHFKLKVLITLTRSGLGGR